MIIEQKNIINENIVFDYNSTLFGGTEYMAKNLHEKVLPNKEKLNNYKTFVLPGPLPDFKKVINQEKDVILYIHNPFFQFHESVLFGYKDPRFLKKIKYIVVVSNWQKKIIQKELEISSKKIIVIANSFDPINKNKNKFNEFDKVKIIYTSSPDRGLEILCESLQYIKKDFELNIFSDIFPETLNENDLFKKTEKDERVMFFGKTPRKALRKYFSDSHIWAYPSIFLETFCISLVEAISAECLTIYPDLGALKETGNNFGICYEYEKDKKNHVKKFAKILNSAITEIENKKFNPKNQAKIIEKKYNWERFEKEWENFYELL